MNRGKSYKTIKEFYQPRINSTKEHFNYNPQIVNQVTMIEEDDIIPDIPDSNPNIIPAIIPDISIDMKWENTYATLTDPNVWGPSFWFSLHNGALRYPKHASKIVADKMKNFIIGIPYILPCADCAEHARAHIENNYNNLDTITSGNDNLFRFFVEFHNYVNRRYNKTEMSVENAKQLYSGKIKVMKMSYKKK